MTNKSQRNQPEFPEIKKKPLAKKGRGLSAPPRIKDKGDTLKTPEKAEAVSAKKPARSYSVNTLISEMHGDILEELALNIRKKEGKRPKIAEVIERSLEALKKAKS